MTIPLRLVEHDPLDVPYMVLGDDDELQPGDCWPNEWGRGGWTVVLPNHTLWHSQIPSSNGTLWTVTGDGPRNLTVVPSIDDQSPSRPWHGFITNGEIRSV